MENPLPKHIAIVMDGNGRWAQQRSLPRIFGHRAGVKTVKEIVSACAKKGIAVLTLFAFSSENWQRPQQEVEGLMELFISSLKKEIREMAKNNVRFKMIGERSAFSEALQKEIQLAEEDTAKNQGLTLVIAANYGGRWDIFQAAKKMAAALSEQKMSLENIDINMFANHTALADYPEPDLFIRTGGEQRISNFLLWQLAYTELYFTSILWPDFNTVALETALENFAGRQRRFGRVGDNA